MPRFTRMITGTGRLRSSSAPIGGLLFKINSSTSTDFITGNQSTIFDSSTNTTYCIWNFTNPSNSKASFQIAAITSDGALSWAKRYTSDSNYTLRATLPGGGSMSGQSATHLFIAANTKVDTWNEKAAVIKISKTDGSIAYSYYLSTGAGNEDNFAAYDSFNNKWFFSYKQFGAGHNLLCTDATTFSSHFYYSGMNWGGSNGSPEQDFGLFVNQDTGTVYSVVRKYNDAGTFTYSHIMPMTYINIGSARKLYFDINSGETDIRALSFISGSTDVYVYSRAASSISRFNSGITTQSGSTYAIPYNQANFGMKTVNSLLLNGHSGSGGYFSALDTSTTPPTLKFQKRLRTANSLYTAYNDSGGLTSTYAYLTFHESDASSGYNGYWIKLPIDKTNAFTGSLGSQTNIENASIGSITTDTTLTSDSQNASGTDQGSFSLTSYGVTATTWSPTYTLTGF